MMLSHIHEAHDLMLVFVASLPYQHIVLHYCEEFAEEVRGLRDQVSFCGDAVSMLISKGVCQVK